MRFHRRLAERGGEPVKRTVEDNSEGVERRSEGGEDGEVEALRILEKAGVKRDASGPYEDLVRALMNAGVKERRIGFIVRSFKYYDLGDLKSLKKGMVCAGVPLSSQRIVLALYAMKAGVCSPSRVDDMLRKLGYDLPR